MRMRLYEPVSLVIIVVATLGIIAGLVDYWKHRNDDADGRCGVIESYTRL